MPELDRSRQPDILDLADDHIRAMSDDEAREALYRMSEKIKEIFIYYDDLITQLSDAVTVVEDQLP